MFALFICWCWWTFRPGFFFFIVFLWAVWKLFSGYLRLDPVGSSMPLICLPIPKHPQLLSPIPSPLYLSYLASLFLCLLSVLLLTSTPTPLTYQLHGHCMPHSLLLPWRPYPGKVPLGGFQVTGSMAGP